MERTWESMSNKLNKGILSAVTELRFEQMTPVQVKSRFIALYSVLYEYVNRILTRPTKSPASRGRLDRECGRGERE